MFVATSPAAVARPHRQLKVELAQSPSEVRAAQRLRYRVFAEEMGAEVKGREPGLDEDFFDPWCEHLIVSDSITGEVVGTYRILTADRARQLGTFYSDTEFDLTRLFMLRPRMVEIGRACVDARYRSGPAIMLLWQGLAQFMRERSYEYLIGCASVSMQDGGINAQQVFQHVRQRHLAPIEYRCSSAPTVATRRERSCRRRRTRAHPSLLKGYLRLGAWIGGEPAWDPDFNTADLFVFLPLARVEPRYARHYLGAS
ncbi:MAG: GNAT family N-acetyltransferase [Betaproteobacteria bacterium]|nr:GNAT family N-acetyltransferase [Betaproteobacteria bacterium]